MSAIVIVEDSVDQREVLADALAAPGLEVRGFGDPLEALRDIAAQPPSLVLLDWYLPKLHGEAFVRRMRSEAASRDVPIVVITGALRIDTAGVDAVLVKPVDLDELLSVIARIVRPERRMAANGGYALSAP